MKTKTIFKPLIPATAKIIPTRLFQQFITNFIPIFTLHRFDHPDRNISGQDPEDIRRCLQYLRKNKYQPLSLAELGKMCRSGKKPGEKSVIFTIDDGFIDQFEIAAPLFEEYEIPVTFFLITDFLDKKIWPWDDQLRYLLSKATAGKHNVILDGSNYELQFNDQKERQQCRYSLYEILKSSDNSTIYDKVLSLYNQLNVEMPKSTPEDYSPMSWDQANELTRRGHSIAAHSRSHRILSQLSDKDAEYEISSSLKLTKEYVPQAASLFAYPTGRIGDFTDREADILNKLDVDLSVSTEHRHFTVGRHGHGLARQQAPRLIMPSNINDFIQHITWIEFIRS